MRIIKTNRLSKKQQDEILKLQIESFNQEELKNIAFLSNNFNIDRSIPCFYMAYSEKKLIAFLTIFIPTIEEAEILAVTHPEYRLKGCFKKLFKSAKETLKKAGINKVLFVVESKSKSGLNVVNSIKCNEINHSEYRMSYNNKENVKEVKDLKFVKVDNYNKDIFIGITQDGFDDENDEFADAVIQNNNIEAYIAYKNEEPIGCFNLNYEKDKAFFYGLVVVSGHRNEGLGKKIVRFAINKSMENAERVILDVDSENLAAFNLYKKCGFNIDFQIDYYNYEI